MIPTEKLQQHVHLVIHGRVQGVFYRASLKEQADRLGVAGWCRNLPTGAVEAVFWGDHETVDSLVAWCRQGPPHAVVETVEVTVLPLDETPAYNIFEVRS